MKSESRIKEYMKELEKEMDIDRSTSSTERTIWALRWVLKDEDD